MRVRIKDPTICQNVEFFLELLRRTEFKGEKESKSAQEVFKAYVNRETGQFLFQEALDGSDQSKQRDWKAVVICYAYRPEEGELYFEVDEPLREENTRTGDDLSPPAFQILSQTLRLFNELCHRLKGPSDIKTKVSVLTRLQVDATDSAPDRNLIISTWHNVDRLEAEGLLKDKPIGSFFFRKDEFTEFLERQLSHQLGKKVKCMTLTYKNAEGKICDTVLVHFTNGWQIYNDDPSLNQKTYEDLKALVEARSEELKYPMYA